MSTPNPGDGQLDDLDQSSYLDLLRNSSFIRTISEIATKAVNPLRLHDTTSLDYGEDHNNRSGYLSSSMDGKFLLKTLSAIKNGIDSSSVDESIAKELNDSVAKITEDFKTYGNANLLELQKLIDDVTAAKDSDGNRSIKIDHEDDVKAAVNQAMIDDMLMDKSGDLIDDLIDAAKQLNLSSQEPINKLDEGLISINQFLEQLRTDGINTDSLENIVKFHTSAQNASSLEIERAMTSLNESIVPRQEVDDLKSLYLSGQMSSDSLMEKFEEFSKQGALGEDGSKLLRDLATVLKMIEANTDPSNNELSNAEKIVQNNQFDLERSNNSLLEEMLDKLEVNDNDEVRAGLLDGASSAEEAGEKVAGGLIDRAMDLFGNKDGGVDIDGGTREEDRQGRRRGRSGRRGGTGGGGGPSPRRGIFGRLKDGASNLASRAGGAVRGAGPALGLAGKVAAPLAVATSLGMAAYDYSEAESSEERKDAVGTGLGGAAGALAGAKLGAMGGAAIGSFVPVVGTAAGAAVGGLVGAAAGAMAGTSVGQTISGWFSDITDTIPDKVKESGLLNQVDYIDRVMMPAVQADLASKSPSYGPEDLDDLKTYRAKLIKQIPSELEKTFDKEDFKGKSTEEKMDFISKHYATLKDTNESLYKSLLTAMPEKFDLLKDIDFSSMIPDVKSVATGLMDKFSNAVSETSQEIGSSGGFINWAKEVVAGPRLSSSGPAVSAQMQSATPSKSLSPSVVAGGLGSLSKKYESGSRGVATISTGKGDKGGVSYGTYQLASNTGTMDAFLKSQEGTKYRDRFSGLKAGSAEFSKVYSQIVSQDGDGFNTAQHDFIQRTHFEPVRKYAEKLGIDTNNKAIQEALWSQSVQQSYRGNKVILDSVAASGVDLKNSDQVLRAIYSKRTDYASQFASSAATTDRYKKELSDALALNNTTGTTDPGTMMAKADAPKTEGAPQVAKADAPKIIPEPTADVAKSVSPTNMTAVHGDKVIADRTPDPKVTTLATSSTPTALASNAPLNLDVPLTGEEVKLIKHYTDQGMDSPAKLAVATGIPLTKIRNYTGDQMRSNSTLVQSSGDIKDAQKMAKTSDQESSTQKQQAPVVVASGGGSPAPNPMDEFRISDNSLSLAAVIS